MTEANKEEQAVPLCNCLGCQCGQACEFKAAEGTNNPVTVVAHPWMSPGGPHYPRVSPIAAALPVMSSEEIEQRLRKELFYLSDEEFAQQARYDISNFTGDGKPRYESFQKVDGKWVAVKPGYNADGTPVESDPNDWFYQTGYPPGFGPRHHRSLFPSLAALYLANENTPSSTMDSVSYGRQFLDKFPLVVWGSKQQVDENSVFNNTAIEAQTSTLMKKD